MTSTATTKQTFVVWAPDYADDGALARRLAVRPAHAEGIHKGVADGFIKYAGPTHAPDSPADGEKKLNGSLLVVEAESAAAVRAALEKDPYWDGNVWDKERLEIKGITVTVNSH
ncbi:hypothetical protein BC834DRAFT_829480 [Gloeopeniophorella convolvens]|nr:hypothetical protein BC834DRAFT_829480 [Gloeopeniophorella convolvens]